MPRLSLVETGSAKSHRVDGSEVLVGRDPSCGIVLEGEEAKTVSGRHARFFFDNDKWYVEDAESRNGTYVGTRKLEPGARHALTVGEVIGLGLTGTQLAVRELTGRSLAATMLEATPAPAPMAAPGDAVRLVLRGPSGARFIGQGDRITIGRSLDCVIRVEGESATSVSRVHADVALANGQAMLRDGGSRHGTFLNGQRIEGTSALKIGDVLMLGPGGPALTVEDVGIIPRGAAVPATAAHASAGEATAGPTAVRAGAQKRPSPAKADRDSANEAAGWPTPPTDSPSIRKSAGPRRGPSPGAVESRRSTAVMIGGAVLLAAVIAAGLFIAKGRTARPTEDDVRQQAEEIEEIGRAHV